MLLGSRKNKLLSAIQRSTISAEPNWVSKCAGLPICIVAAIVLGYTPQQAHAQDDEDLSDLFSLEEIVVTARKRPEDLQDAPVAVAALGAQTIEDAGIGGINDYAKLIPNLTVIDSQSSAFAFVLIRGITQVRNTESSVAYVLDGVLNTSPFGFSQELVDIEQIEVLKGPQGALYGRNAVGGAINITTKAPTNEFEGFVKGSLGDGDMRGVQGAISGPIIEDTLLFRLTGAVSEADGWRDNEFLNEPVDPYEKVGFRGKLLYTPSETISADLRVSVQEDKGVGQTWANIGPAFQCQGNETLATPQFCIVGGNPVSPAPNAPVPGIIGNPNDNTPDIQGNVLGKDRRDILNVSLKMDWELPFASLTSITSYDEIDVVFYGDNFPYYSARTAFTSQRRDNESISQEFRLTSPQEDQLRWLAGLYYAETDFDFTALVAPDVVGSEPFFAEDTPHPSLVPGAANNQYTSDKNKNESFSVFGQVSYDVTDNVEVSLALRYDDEERTQIVNTPDVFAADFTTLSFGDKRSADFSSTQPKLTVSWQPAETVTLYANYAQAFRSGGFNPSDIQNRVQQIGFVANALGVQDIYEQEETEGFELGFKTEWLEGNLRLNGALFYTKVDDQFSFSFLPGLNNSQVVRNVDESEIEGAEVDFQWVMNDTMRLSGGLGYTSTEITKWASESQFEGNSLPYIPEITASLSYELRHDFGGDMLGYLRFDWQYLDDTPMNASNFTERDALDLLSIRVNLDIGENYSIAAWVSNVTDEDYFAEYGPPGFAFPAAPRQSGAEIKYRF